jgi:hypothetical protein
MRAEAIDEDSLVIIMQKVEALAGPHIDLTRLLSEA